MLTTRKQVAMAILCLTDVSSLQLTSRVSEECKTRGDSAGTRCGGLVFSLLVIIGHDCRGRAESILLSEIVAGI